jgi:hypothetical protein
MGMLTILVEPRTNALLAAVAFDIEELPNSATEFLTC